MTNTPFIPLTDAVLQDVTFTVTIAGQEVVVQYHARYFVAADVAHLAFRSPHVPPRRIPLSETGYWSHFVPMHELSSAPSVEEYAIAVARAVMQEKLSLKETDREEGAQLALF